MVNLHEVAVLCAFNATGFGGSVADKGVTEEVTEQHSTEADVFRVRKNLFPASTCGKDNAFVRVKSHISKTREAHYKGTLEYETGWQLLPLAAHPAHHEVMTAAKAVFNDKCLPELRGEYRGLVEAARRAHKGTFDAALYTHVDEFCDRFTLSFQYRPVPAGVALPEQLRGFGDQLDRDNVKRVEAAVSETYRRLLEPVIDLAQRLVDPETRRLSYIVESVRVVAGRIETLNLTGDARLTNAALRINQILDGVSAEALEANAGLRTEKAQQIIELARTFGNIGGRKLAA